MGMPCKGACKPPRCQMSFARCLTCECHVSEPSKPANPPFTGYMGTPCFRTPKIVHLHGIPCNFCMILQQAFPTWNPHVNVVPFRNSHGFPMWEVFFLWPLIWVCHVNNKKSVQTARNMGNPCKRMTISQQHGISNIMYKCMGTTAYMTPSHFFPFKAFLKGNIVLKKAFS